ncbi:unnamed protein product [Trichobilharzia regenti]|nr:unnamed protein product [Trichobilharzia regenti]
MTSDQLKCLIFNCGLKSPEEADIRTRLLLRVRRDPNMSLQMVTAEYQSLVNLNNDTAVVEEKSQSSELGSVNAVENSPTTVKLVERQSQNSV